MDGVFISSAVSVWLHTSSILINSACEGKECNDERGVFMSVPDLRSGVEEGDDSESNDSVSSSGEAVRWVGLHEAALLGLHSTLSGLSTMVSGNLASSLSRCGLHDRADTRRLDDKKGWGISRLWLRFPLPRGGEAQEVPGEGQRCFVSLASLGLVIFIGACKTALDAPWRKSSDLCPE